MAAGGELRGDVLQMSVASEMFGCCCQVFRGSAISDGCWLQAQHNAVRPFSGMCSTSSTHPDQLAIAQGRVV